MLPYETIFVDVLVPVYNASATIIETFNSVVNQSVPLHLSDFFAERRLDVAVCCVNDGSTDDSLVKLKGLQESLAKMANTTKDTNISIQLLLDSSATSKGAPTARNSAAQLRAKQSEHHIFVWLDSDDTMHPHRISEQVYSMLQSADRDRLLLGSQFDRDPPDSTWHYTQWANNLTKERLLLERFREVTVLQPTWCMMRSRFEELGGYITSKSNQLLSQSGVLQLVYKNEANESLRLAEDLRFFHAHLCADGILRIVPKKLLVYRHRAAYSQSAQTSRNLLCQLRAMALEFCVLTKWEKFAVWGAGRDGKNFLKALSEESRKKVVCMVDVDHKKIEAGFYDNKDMNIHIPIVHFSLLAKDPRMRDDLKEAYFSQIECISGRISKERPQTAKMTHTGPPPFKKFKLFNAPKLNLHDLPCLPVVVCVAMYRTDGVLERNVGSIGRQEGHDLWHFS